jgi:hypothetical protein
MPGSTSSVAAAAAASRAGERSLTAPASHDGWHAGALGGGAPAPVGTGPNPESTDGDRRVV